MNFKQAISRVGAIAAKIEREFLIIFVIAIVLIVFLTVVFRYSPITGQTLWIEEVGRYSLLWLSFWAAGSAERVNGHFRFDMFEVMAKGKLQILIQLFTKTILTVSLGILIYWEFIYTWITKGRTTLVLQWPMPIWVIPLILGTLLMFIHALIATIKLVQRLIKQ